MSLYNKLKEEVLKLFYGLPINIHCSENQILLSVSRYELLNTREIKINEIKYQTRDIGLANMILANKYVKNICSNEELEEDLWETVLEDLLEEKKIRIKPSVFRKENIKIVVDNTRRDFVKKR